MRTAYGKAWAAQADGAVHFGQLRTLQVAAQGQIHIQVLAVVQLATEQIPSLPLPSEAAIRASLILATRLNENIACLFCCLSQSYRDHLI